MGYIPMRLWLHGCRCCYLSTVDCRLSVVYFAVAVVVVLVVVVFAVVGGVVVVVSVVFSSS